MALTLANTQELSYLILRMPKILVQKVYYGLDHQGL